MNFSSINDKIRNAIPDLPYRNFFIRSAKMVVVAAVTSSIGLASLMLLDKTGAATIAAMFGARSVLDLAPFVVGGGTATLGCASGLLQVRGHQMFEVTQNNFIDCLNYIKDSYATSFKRTTIPLGTAVLGMLYCPR